MTISDFKQTPEYQRLTDQEQAFLLEYVANGFNVVAAAQTAFETGSTRSAYVYGRRVLTRPRVEAALERWGGAEEVGVHEIFSDLRAAMKQNKRISAKVAAIRLACELKGLLKKEELPGVMQPQLPEQVIKLLAERITEQPVGRILEKMGIQEVTIEAEHAKGKTSKDVSSK